MGRFSILCWLLTEYIKVIDERYCVTVWWNINELFECPELSAVPDNVFALNNQGHKDVFNSGLMVLQPSEATFSSF